jgi:hypothetical protein
MKSTILLALAAAIGSASAQDTLYRVSLESRADAHTTWTYTTVATMVKTKETKTRYLVTDHAGAILATFPYQLNAGRKEYSETGAVTPGLHATRSTVQVSATVPPLHLVSQSDGSQGGDPAFYEEQQGRSSLLKIGTETFAVIAKLTGPTRRVDFSNLGATSRVSAGAWTTSLDKALTTKTLLSPALGEAQPRTLDMAKALVRQALTAKGYVKVGP